MEEIFIKAYKDIFYCEGTVLDNGELLPLTVHDKLLYFHMLDRKKLFTDRGGMHFEGQDTIASVLHIDRKTIIKSLTKLREAGIITGYKQKHPVGGYSRWVYSDVQYPLKTYGNKMVVQAARPDTTSEEFDDPF